MIRVPYAAFAILFALVAFAARAFARFIDSFALAAPDSFLFGAVSAFPPFCSAWNAAQRFRWAAAILRLAAADMLRFGLRAPLTAGAACPSTCFWLNPPDRAIANRGHRGLDLLAFGFVANESHFQGGSVYLYHYSLLIDHLRLI
jgi:hypothetical protein